MYFIVVAGDQWLSSFSLPSSVGEIDSQFMEKNQKLFSSLERLGKNKYVLVQRGFPPCCKANT